MESLKKTFIFGMIFLLVTPWDYAFGKSKSPTDKMVEEYLILIRTAIKSRDMSSDEFKKTYEFFKTLGLKKNSLSTQELNTLKSFVSTLKQFPKGIGSSKDREQLKMRAFERNKGYLETFIRDTQGNPNILKINSAFFGIVDIDVVCKLGHVGTWAGLGLTVGVGIGFGKCIRSDFRGFVATLPSASIGFGAGGALEGKVQFVKYKHDRFATGLKAKSIKSGSGSIAVGAGVAFSSEEGVVGLTAGLGTQGSFQAGGLIRISPKYFDFSLIRSELGIPETTGKTTVDQTMASYNDAAKQFDPKNPNIEDSLIVQGDKFNPDFSAPNAIDLKPVTLQKVSKDFGVAPEKLIQEVEGEIGSD